MKFQRCVGGCRLQNSGLEAQAFSLYKKKEKLSKGNLTGGFRHI